MLNITPAAIQQLKQLMLEHPEDPIVRLTLSDLDEHRLVFSLTLEDRTQPDDAVREIDGVTVAVEAKSVARTDGVTMDYREGHGFTFQHPDPQDALRLDLFNLN